MTSNGRLPQNIISGISQQPLIVSYSNFKVLIIKPHITNPQNEDNLKTSREEYIRNHLLDQNQI